MIRADHWKLRPSLQALRSVALHVLKTLRSVVIFRFLTSAGVACPIDLSAQRAHRLGCAECGCHDEPEATSWRAFLGTDDAYTTA